jgi:hypothetical protein
MNKLTSSVSAVTERLYAEALALSDEGGTLFRNIDCQLSTGPMWHDSSLALACERTRTTMILKDALRWLEVSPSAQSRAAPAGGARRPLRFENCSSPADEVWLALLPEGVKSFIRSVERLYARLLWLERSTAVDAVAASATELVGNSIVSLAQWRSAHADRELARA